MVLFHFHENDSNNTCFIVNIQYQFKDVKIKCSKKRTLAQLQPINIYSIFIIIYVFPGYLRIRSYQMKTLLLTEYIGSTKSGINLFESQSMSQKS